MTVFTAKQITGLLVSKSKLLKAMKAIVSYVEAKEPKSLSEANHMLSLIGLMASETLAEIETA